MSLPQGCLVRITADAIVGNDPCILYAAYLFAGSDASSMQFTDDADGLATNIFEMNTVANQGCFVNFAELGGISFPSIGLYVDITGTGAIGYVWLSNVGAP
ncbi:MAG: hypothetical protein WC935_00240 [Thermoleophilia bacterium]